MLELEDRRSSLRGRAALRAELEERASADRDGAADARAAAQDASSITSITCNVTHYTMI